jgi:hypothetical protein
MYEAKVAYVLLSLTGAMASGSAIECTIEHEGCFTAQKRDGSIAGLMLPRRRAFVRTTKSGIAFTGSETGPTAHELSFCGRGTAATWQISINADAIQRDKVDLPTLSAIEIGKVAILYRALQ